MWWRIFLYLFVIALVAGVVIAAAAGAYVFRLSRDLPNYEALQSYEPPITTRVHAGDGRVIAQYARERRVFIPIEAIPDHVIQAFLAAEDKKFYSHPGIDPVGMARGAVRVAQAKLEGRNRLQSGSTITQQVAKNFLLTSDQTIERKVKEILIAFQMEDAFSKNHILELYLNEIYFGARSFGIAAAALTYFDKSLNELTLEEAAYLAALPKGPNNYHPQEDREAALGRRNWVLNQMADAGFISLQEAMAAAEKPLGADPSWSSADEPGADWFAEEVRRRLLADFGEDELYDGGLSVRTSLDLPLQAAAQQALRKGLIDHDKRRGWRGPIASFGPETNLQGRLDALRADLGLGGLTLAGVTRVDAETAELVSVTGEPLTLTREAALWALGEGEDAPGLDGILKVGDAIVVEEDEEGSLTLRQLPEADGAIVAMDPRTGRVLALVGGYDFARSQFNRATQAERQPGSAFKPFVYAAALEDRFDPTSIVLDAPFAANLGDASLGYYKPSNYTDRYYGPSTLRTGIEKSRNVMTVRLAQRLGITPVVELASEVGLDDNMRPVLATALGASAVSPLELTAAYASFANGGKRVEPVLIDRVQDRRGRTIMKGQDSSCARCSRPVEPGGELPEPVYDRPRVVSRQVAYQITSMLEGVIERGTGRVVGSIEKPLAGKSGTSNDFRDAWFVGYSPQLVVAVYIGRDDNESLGQRESGGRTAAPVFRDVMAEALEGEPARPFQVPPGIRLVRINAETGERAQPGDTVVITEAFKAGESPREPGSAEEERELMDGLY